MPDPQASDVSLDRPVQSMLVAARVTHRGLARRLGVESSSIRDGASIKLATLARIAVALGGRLEIRFVAAEIEKSTTDEKK